MAMAVGVVSFPPCLFHFLSFCLFIVTVTGEIFVFLSSFYCCKIFIVVVVAVVDVVSALFYPIFFHFFSF